MNRISSPELDIFQNRPLKFWSWAWLCQVPDAVVNGKLTGMGFKEKLGETYLIRVSDQETLSELIEMEIEIANHSMRIANIRL